MKQNGRISKIMAYVWMTVAGLAVLLTVGVLISKWYVLLLLAEWIWFVLPGVVAFRRLYRDTPHAQGITWLFGAPLGYAMSSFLLLAAWLLGMHSGLLLLICPAIAFLIALFLPSLGPDLRVPRFNSRDTIVAALMVLLAIGVVAWPFSRVGTNLPDGRAYRAYFRADFIWEMAVVAEVSKGDTIPANPYLNKEPLHYYWLFHLFSSLEYRSLNSLDAELRLDRLVLINNTLTCLMFMLFFYGLVRHFTSSAYAAGIGCLFAILFTSAEGLYILAKFVPGGSLEVVRNYNIDAISRWLFGSLPVDGLQRLLLYQPQHQMGLALSFIALLLMIQQWRRPRIFIAAVAGFLLAGGLLISSVSALMLTVITGIVALVSIIRTRAWRVGIISALVAAVPILTAIGLSFLLHYVEPGDSHLVFGAHRMAFENTLISLLLSFGPIVVAALPGVWVLCRRAGASRLVFFFSVMVISILCYFYVDIPEHQSVYIGWRAAHLIFIVLACVIAVGVHHLVLHRKKSLLPRLAWAFFFLFCALIAAPTVAIDLYNTQDVYNRNLNPARNLWTLVLSRDELMGFRWLRRNTPLDARVQIEPTVRNPNSWAYIPAFAERRMAAGIPISMIPLAPYEAASAKVREIYLSTDPDFILRQAQMLGINYLVIGPVEQDEYPGMAEVLKHAPKSFKKVFSQPTFKIYQVKKE